MTITVDRHFEYSRLIEDIAEVQALSSMRQFYTEDAGYQLALKVDTDLINVATGFGDGTRTVSPATANWVNSNSYYALNDGDITAYAADTVTAADQIQDNHIRGLIKEMDDADVPMDNRVLVIPPAARKQIMGIDRYVSSDFVGGRGVESGLIGNLYGVDIYVSSNCPVIETAVTTLRQLLTLVVACSSTRTLSFLQSKWLYVLRLSTSRNTCLRCSRLTLCTALKLTVPKQDSSSLSQTLKFCTGVAMAPFFFSVFSGVVYAYLSW